MTIAQILSRCADNSNETRYELTAKIFPHQIIKHRSELLSRNWPAATSRLPTLISAQLVKKAIKTFDKSRDIFPDFLKIFSTVVNVTASTKEANS
ncbi:hypothetical protein CSB45_00600 [candidate division KSB3 bacterium]|uniref:Uncharacterized protein n=1 Tax=candidate division KSB3 bacterium TaxID=2044937 RepID=A0A2G6EEI7_9BACT|nr:MAG: hypothetical protein CSB45_00600 [candidate division KSB3 bacterium]